MIRVGVNGYGTIGKRVADAVDAQPDMEVIGVAKTQPNFEAHTAVKRGYPMYAAIPERMPLFSEAGIDVEGAVDEMVADADIVVDCTPSGIGAENKALYESHDTPAIFQGGEDADVGEVSFNARANYDDARGVDYVRTVSCNTTGLSRIIAPLREEYGVEKVRATLVRRGGDPGQNSRGPINDILPNPISIPSHHGPDVNTIFPDLAIDTLGLKVPATLMHVHSLNVTLEDDVTAAHVRQLLESESRVYVIPEGLGIDGAGKLKDFALDAGRPRGDLWENCVWGESIAIEGRDLYLFQAIHQESDVIPENVDAIRAMMESVDQAESMVTTDDYLGVGITGDPSGFSNEDEAEAVTETEIADD
ncbi:type II glyceraldehyde-3-phosphate dehydrogenase [Halogeometricum borinquense]|uniref:Glyceraldehyde-3-phosphate dehydrogenase n=1 Tax=Halogeometricum borinquense TaxID=60847 RepID=A0A6C0UCX2_9EURY|nr:type II glyceraldehyde-3-phosphate dehydrogenase [Halogeometricum borinquense]QIB73172.1 type II glyceraldehyde-3-phosphate dehydrogenase [Halogeometricum borinquense]QIQ77432.1 type II glyceraldehyde-3-phosphate dehydrogenase [Halogeometricum borinquense]